MSVTAPPTVSSYALALGDDALVLAQRCAEWVTRAPQLEEDVALANIGLDLLGQARALLTYAGHAEGAGRDEDALAYLRDGRDFRNLRIVEQPNEDFAVSTARLLLFSAYQHGLYEALTRSTDPTLAAIAAKAVKEVAYHRDHAAGWVLRLGDGTTTSHERMQAGLDRMWPYVEEMFDASWLHGPGGGLVATGIAVDPAGLRPGWDAAVGAILAEATLEVPSPTQHVHGGRHGVHGDALHALLAELQQVHRAHPGAAW